LKKNILDYFEEIVDKFGNNIAFEDQNNNITYFELKRKAKIMGYIISNKYKKRNHPIVVHMEKKVFCLIAFLGVLYSGNCYVCLDKYMSVERKKNICKRINPMLIITDSDIDFYDNCDSVKYEKFNLDILPEELKKLDNVVDEIIEVDPAYILFTSGSTGNPKGSVILHKSVISYAKWVIEKFEIDNNSIFGSQTPFYFSMSVLDIYATIFSGARLNIIPHMYFSFPIKLIEYLNEKKINVIYWVPSALSIVANWNTFDLKKPKYLNKILFAGEVMPVKQLNIWRKNLPDALFANLFGPTEITDIALYYIVDRDYTEKENLPIGIVADNMNAFVINEDGMCVDDGQEGELYFRGNYVGAGYYNDLENTQKYFVQNPLNKHYPEIVYKTGDLVKKKDGLYWYLGRKDNQIKHMGYRIELGEIETAFNSCKEVDLAACIYIQEQDVLVVYYEGKIAYGDLKKYVEKYLPAYMIPTEVRKIKHIPLNRNGKIDRLQLTQLYYDEGVNI